MEFKIEIGPYLDPKEEKNHVIFSKRMEGIRTDLENFIKEWWDRDAPNMHINLSPKLELCTVGNVHSAPAKIIIVSTRHNIPRAEIIFPMNQVPKIKFLMNISGATLPVHDLISGREIEYEFVDSQIIDYIWWQINNYFKTTEIVVATELLFYSSGRLESMAENKMKASL